MIPVTSMIYKLDQKLNKLSTSYHQQIFLEDKILVLNEAQIKVLKSKIDVNNIYNLGLDAFKKRYEDLQCLVVDYEALVLKESNPTLNTYSASVASLTLQYMMHIDSYLLGNKGNCSDHPINSTLVKHSDLTTLLRNSDYVPSFEYQETLMTISSNNFNYYTDGSFTLIDTWVSYLRYPVYIDYVGYIHLDGTASITTNCEMPGYMEDEIVDTAWEMLAMYTENNPATQFAAAQKKQDE
jgi:hypothetical protein